ncbi:MAG: glycine cleavage system aminomethyltransferase GcvT [Verrucomicrobia bacterium]|nr:glycine cleavage system aminomethyltransferase GcvT [Kiritimatiellia bacterium]MCP5489168.1 glycine cleavage system aminomethyltransferase GcvT [Verrucomicrobiota bacterium]
MIPVQRTPLYEEHVRLGAKMAPFGGWEMPIQYRGILPEHEATRTASTMFDICHMGELEVKGPTATADLERLLTLSVSTLKPGQCRYGYLLRDDGGVLDDLTCYKFDDEHYWLVVNAATAGRDADWIRVHLSEETEFEDISSRIAKLDIQGPTSRQGIEKAIGAALPDLPYFYSEPIRVMGIDCLLSRTGYTGEWGYELYFPAAEAVSFWRLFLESGIQPAGLGARDTLRLEVGYPLYGHELRETQSPVAAARGNFIARDKAFIGKATVLRELSDGVPRYLAAIALDGKRAARDGDRLFTDAGEVGVVTSGSLAPSLGHAIALAYLDAGLCEPGTRLEVDLRGKRLPCVVVTLPFYKQGTARNKKTTG